MTKTQRQIPDSPTRFIAWLRRQPRSRRFKREDSEQCPLGAYSGYSVGIVTYGPHTPGGLLGDRLYALPRWAQLFVERWDESKYATAAGALRVMLQVQK